MDGPGLPKGGPGTPKEGPGMPKDGPGTPKGVSGRLLNAAGSGKPINDADSGRPGTDSGSGKPGTDSGSGKPAIDAGSGSGRPRNDAGSGGPANDAGSGRPLKDSGSGRPTIDAGSGRATQIPGSVKLSSTNIEKDRIGSSNSISSSKAPLPKTSAVDRLSKLGTKEGNPSTKPPLPVSSRDRTSSSSTNLGGGFPQARTSSNTPGGGFPQPRSSRVSSLRMGGASGGRPSMLFFGDSDNAASAAFGSARVPVYGSRPDRVKLDARLGRSAKEEAVRDDYLTSSGLQAALRDALKSLFLLPELPANPYYHLANVLSTYVDQSPGWRMSDSDITGAYDLEGDCEVVDEDTRMCKHSGSMHAWGLPHVIRLTSKKGINIVRSITNDQLPDSFFPNSQPFSVNNEAYEIQVMCSVQAMSALWFPDKIELPEIELRADVLVKGPGLEEAVKLFLDLIITDMEDLMNVPIYFVEGVSFHDVDSMPLEGEQRERTDIKFQLEDIYNKLDEYEKTGQRLILGNKCAKVEAVVMVDEAGTVVSGTAASVVESDALRYKLASKTYYFHFCSLEESKVGYDQFSHYGSLPYEALYEGYFHDKTAMKHYLSMFSSFKPSANDPYSAENREPNVEALARKISKGIYSSNSLSAFRQLLLYVMLSDSEVTFPERPWTQVESLEEMVSVAKQGKSDEEYILSTVPNLLRIIYSAAETLRGMAHEVEAVRIVSYLWPSKLALIHATAGKEAGQTPHLREDGLYSAPGTGDSRRTLRTPEVSDAMLVWLKTFDMNSRLVGQLIHLKKGIRAATGKRLFSGCSVLLGLLFSVVPDELPQTGNVQIMKNMQGVSRLAVSILDVLALTVSHGFLNRCSDVAWALQKLNIPIQSISERTVWSPTYAGNEFLLPEWMLDVNSVVGSQVSTGGLAERVGAEGVMLQYAVDTRLDELLTVIWHQATQPPMPVNPYPKLMHIIRSRAAKMELWNEEEVEVVEVLLNDLTMSESPNWMYSGHRSALAMKRWRSKVVAVPGSATVLADVDENCVFGCYAAVSMADAQSLQVLNNSLSGVFAERHWQRGAYLAEAIPSLIGDCSMTNAMGFGDLITPSMFKAGYKYRQPAPFEHPRFYTITAEEHHLVNGPTRKDAAIAFAEEVVASLIHIHDSTNHLVHHLSIGGEEVEEDYLQRLLSPAQTGRPGTAKSSRKHVQYKMSDLKDATKKEKVVEDLAAAAKHYQQGSHCASVQLYICSRTHLYVTVKRWLTFQYSKVVPQLKLHISVTHDARTASRDGQRPSTADKANQFWDRHVYTRVFLSEFCSRTWYTWNREKGDPSQPFHYQHMIANCMVEAKKLQAEGRMLEMLKLMLLCSVATQDDGGIFRYSRVCLSTSQEMKALMELNGALVDLLREGMDPLVKEKIENERLRSTFLTYCNRLGRAMTSPKYCYFTGMSTLVPPMLEKIRETVVSKFELVGTMLEDMITLNVWTKACESSLANALYDTFTESSMQGSFL